ncbi:hypothetical protein NDU88_001021 [Pleurodeles waltl]|uniref:Uncharacterized protein n=1 Tax=Pleurodeles waltl TaxID=8319 RepID=A0AAV7WN20_PLEWA|nr:hypothetical protein NDU88_001021 [Pleurodeles waltl]
MPPPSSSMTFGQSFESRGPCLSPLSSSVTPTSGNPPDKPDENAKTQGIGTAEKIAQALADHKESKWRPPPGLGSAGPRTCGKGSESLPRTRGRPAPLDRPGDTPALPQCLGRRRDRTEEAGGVAGPRTVGVNRSVGGSRWVT